MKILQNFTHQKILIPVLLIICTAVAYGINIGNLGFYWDEWPFIWFNHALGFNGIMEYFDDSRPFWGYIYSTTLPLLGTNIIAWQLFGIFIRVFASLSMWWGLCQIWPNRSNETSAAALLYAIYPSFSQQSTGLMFGHFILLSGFLFLSIGFMIKSIRNPEKFRIWLTAGLTTSAINLFCAEYFFGIELLRPIILIFVLWELRPNILSRLQSTIRHYLPYLILLMVYVFWRVVIFKFPTYQPETLNGEILSLQSIINLLHTTLLQIKSVTMDAWIRLFNPPFPSDFGPRSLQVYWVVIIASFIFVFSILVFLRNNKNPQAYKPWTGMLLLSIPALFFAGIPFLVTALPVNLDFPADRFTLPYMFGGSLLFVGIVSLLPNNRHYSAVLIALFACFSIGLQFVHSSKYKQDWRIQNDFIWQLHWRAPTIEPASVLLTDNLPHYFESDNSLTAPINWMYAPEYSGGVMPFLVAYISVRENTRMLKLESGFELRQSYRVANFEGNTNNSLVMYFNPPACLRIFDPVRDINLPLLPDTIHRAIPISNPKLIGANVDPDIKPMDFLNSEPEHGWCYYFEKADLARYDEDWKEVARLGDKALATGDYPNDPAERNVLVEGYALTEQWEKAYDQTMKAYKINPLLSKLLCATWGRISDKSNLNAKGLATIQTVSNELNCSIRIQGDNAP